jgi:hypothetical protein
MATVLSCRDLSPELSSPSPTRVRGIVRNYSVSILNYSVSSKGQVVFVTKLSMQRQTVARIKVRLIEI